MYMTTLYENVAFVLKESGSVSGRVVQTARGAEITFNLDRDSEETIARVVNRLKEFHNVNVRFYEYPIEVYEVTLR